MIHVPLSACTVHHNGELCGDTISVLVHLAVLKTSSFNGYVSVCEHNNLYVLLALKVRDVCQLKRRVLCRVTSHCLKEHNQLNFKAVSVVLCVSKILST